MFLPLFSFSPEEIFSGDILLFDVNFFNPQKEMYARTEITTTTSTSNSSPDGTNSNVSSSSQPTDGRGILITDNLNLQDQLQNSTSQETTNIGGINTVTTTTITESVKYYYYLRDPSLGDTKENRVITSRQNTALDLQPLVSQWYSAIRNIAIVASMSVLLYVGIRMLLSSVSQEKAKYKQMLFDWVVGVCLLFFMHYIMVFSVELVEAFNDIIGITTPSVVALEDAIDNQNGNGELGHLDGFDQIVLMEDDEDKYISQKLKDLGMEGLVHEDTNPAQIIWPTNLMGMLRLKAQVSYGDMAFVGYGLCYVMLVLFTIYFTYVYLRRVLYMAFLTMIAPLVALTYPIDKISDGQAQGFNRWLKEYIFNLLLQPLHLLLYTILVTSAYELASTNVVYSLVAIGFMIPAEKLMRSFFGFEKASTPGSFAGAAAGAAMLNSGLQKVLHRKPGGRDGRGKGGNGSDDDDSGSLRIGWNANNEDDNEDDIGNIDSTVAQQAMLDAYDDNYGTEDWDPAERDQMAREAYRNDPGRQYSDEEYEQILRDSGYSDEDIAELMGNTNQEDDAQNHDEQSRLDTRGNINPADEDPNGASRSDMHGNTNSIDEGNNRPIRFAMNGNSNPTEEDDEDNQDDAVEENNTPIRFASNNSRSQARAPQQTNGNRQTIRRPQGIRGRMSANAAANKDFLQRAGQVAKFTATKQVPRKLKEVAPKAIRTGAKLAAGAALGATAAAVGATIGIATGDPSRAASFAGGAALAGGALGASRIDTNPPTPTKSAAQIARERAFWGEDYDRHLAEERIKKWKKDEKKREVIEGQLGVEKTKELYKSGKIDKYLKNEVTSPKDIAALEKLQEENDDVSFKDALLVFDAHDKYGDIDRQKQKDKDDITGGYKRQFQRAGVNEQRAEEKANRITALTTDFDKIKKNLH